MSNVSTQFKKGNPGKPKGAKSKQPPIDIKRKVVTELAGDFFAIMQEFASSTIKSDRRWFADLYAKLLPKESEVAMTGAPVIVQFATAEDLAPDEVPADDPPDSPPA